MGHDVIEDRYARLYEQPFQLASLGNHVLGVCLSYRKCTPKNEFHQTGLGSMQWIGLSAGKFRESVLTYPFNLLKIARQFKPDIIVGASDCLHVILGQWIAAKLNCQYTADLYDDYETFGLAKIPFVKSLYRRALTRAKVISCVSQSLSHHIKSHIAPNALTLSLPSTINQSIFYPRNKNSMRQNFDLPLDTLIVGTAGGLTREKGIDTVYKMFVELISQNPKVVCVIAGVTDPQCTPPQHERIIHLGKLTHERVAELFCALNVGIVYLRNTRYGQLSFPQKAYEMGACKIPMVVAEIGDMKNIFSHDRNELYTPDSHQSLTSAVIKQLESPCLPDLIIESWVEQAKKLETAYQKAIRGN